MLLPLLLIQSLVLIQIDAEESFEDRIPLGQFVFADFCVAVLIQRCQRGCEWFHPDAIIGISARSPRGKIDLSVDDQRSAVNQT